MPASSQGHKGNVKFEVLLPYYGPISRTPAPWLTLSDEIRAAAPPALKIAAG